MANPPGRLPATMIKVLAAELSDQGRLARGKRYWADNAVTDIVIGHGAVTAEIQGSRPEPYVVTITATPGTGVPGKRDVTVAVYVPGRRDLRGVQARRRCHVRPVRRDRCRSAAARALARRHRRRASEPTPASPAARRAGLGRGRAAATALHRRSRTADRAPAGDTAGRSVDRRAGAAACGTGRRSRPGFPGRHADRTRRHPGPPAGGRARRRPRPPRDQLGVSASLQSG